jgi:hypothetical protein
MLAQRIQLLDRCFYEKTTLLLALESSLTESTSFNAINPTQSGISLSSASAPYGTNAAALDAGGTLRYWAVNGSILTFGTSDFTIEFWVSVTGIAGNVSYPYVMQSQKFNLVNGFYITRPGADTGWGGAAKIVFSSCSGTANPCSIGTTTLFLNAGWKFYKLTREGVTYRVYVNDILEATYTSTGITNYSSAANPYVNRAYDPSDGGSYGSGNSGYMKGIRISKGIARNWPTMDDFKSVAGKY